MIDSWKKLLLPKLTEAENLELGLACAAWLCDQRMKKFVALL